jgi:hypothetical protein
MYKSNQLYWGTHTKKITEYVIISIFQRNPQQKIQCYFITVIPTYFQTLKTH